MTRKEATQKEAKPNLKWQRDKDREIVRGIFRFHEVPGGTMEFVFKQYKEDPVEKFTLRDGEIASIPLGVAKHLNNNCWYPQHEYQLDSNGNPMTRMARKIRRCSFQSLEFVDVEGLNPGPDLVTVEDVRI